MQSPTKSHSVQYLEGRYPSVPSSSNHGNNDEVEGTARSRNSKKRSLLSITDNRRNDDSNVGKSALYNDNVVKKNKENNNKTSILSSELNDRKENDNVRNKRRSTQSTRSTRSTRSTDYSRTTIAAVNIQPSNNSSSSKPSPTITFHDKSTDRILSKQSPRSIKEATAMLGFAANEQHATEVISNYDGQNKIILCLKDGLLGALDSFQEYINSGCKEAPSNRSTNEYQEKMGNLLESIGDDVKANMGDLAQPEESMLIGIMHYATENEKNYIHPTREKFKNRMDHHSPCPLIIQSTSINMVMYESTGEYTKPVDNPEVVLMDRICWCCDKGKQNEIDAQCEQILNRAGMAEFLNSNAVSMSSAVSVFIIPTLIFNVIQIHYNKKEPVSILPVGNAAAKMFQRTGNAWGPTLSNSIVHLCGKVNHSEAIIDAMKKLPEQNCVNTDHCFAEWSKALLQERLSRRGIGVEGIRCNFVYNMNWGKLNSDELELIRNSMPSYILKQMKEAVEEAMPQFPAGTPKSEIAKNLSHLNQTWVAMYIKVCKNGTKVGKVLTTVKEAVEEAKSQFPVGTSRVEIVQSLHLGEKEKKRYIASCKNGEVLTTVKEAVEEAKSQFPVGTSRVEIVQSLPLGEKEKKRYIASCKNGEVLTTVKEAVEEAKSQFPVGTSRVEIVQSLHLGEKEKKRYIASCKNGEVLTTVKEAVEEAKSQFPVGTSRVEIVQSLPLGEKEKKRYIASCKNGEVLTTVKEAVEEAKSQFPVGTSRVEIVQSLPLGEKEKKGYIASCKNGTKVGKVLTSVKEAVEEAKSQFPVGTSRVEIVQSLHLGEKEKKRYIKVCKNGEVMTSVNEAMEKAKSQFPVGTSIVDIVQSLPLGEKEKKRYIALCKNMETSMVNRQESAWLKHKTELQVMSKNKKNWVSISVGAEDLRVLVVANSNSSRALQQYFRQQFGSEMACGMLSSHTRWEEIKDYNWEHHSIAHAKFENEKESKKKKADAGKVLGQKKTHEQLRQEFHDSLQNML